MGNKKKYDVIISPRVKEKMSKLSSKDVKKINAAIKKIAISPEKYGKQMDLIEIKALSNEKCDGCGELLHITYDKNNKEYYFDCICGRTFWCREKEFEAGRKEFLKKQKKRKVKR